ncbi:MAG: saccharopine dehydrogenase NADP-binding domain-containing protein [Bdellovibrionota bacterium]
MSDPAWMIYGANGYTGKLAAEKAASLGKKPVLAGRREEAIRPLAERLGLPWRAFSLDSPQEALEGLKGVSLVLHCAGPFSATSKPMVDACLKAGAHYLDITGEIDVFETIHARTEEAKKAKCVLMPGVGFDVVPSDCLAASVAKALPGATELEIAIAGFGSASPGTTKTAVEGIADGGKVRKNGKIVSVPPGNKTREALFPDGEKRFCVSMPWGDVSTAYYSTGVPNITVYFAMPRSVSIGMKLSRPFLPLFGLKPVQNFLKDQVEKRVKGPSETERKRGKVYLWARAADGKGKSVEGTLEVPEGYTFTVDAALACAERVLAGEVPGGAWTPSKAFGADFVTRLPGTKMAVRN